MKTEPTSTLLPSAAEPALVTNYAGKISVINRSMRCLVYGVMGSVPFLGLPIAVQAAQLHHQVARETGETWRPWRLLWIGLAELLVMVALGRRQIIPPLWSMVVFALIIHAWLGLRLWRSYRRTRTRLWNPARLWLSWGGWLAWLSIIVMAQIFAYLVWMVAYMTKGGRF